MVVKYKGLGTGAKKRAIYTSIQNANKRIIKVSLYGQRIMKNLLSISFLIISICVNAQTNNYYFGNLHSHTGFSDGCKDSSTSGVTDPAGAYIYAKLSQHFDFLGISEHNHYSSNKNPGFKLPLYQKGLKMADSANKDPKFLALFGMEWGVSTNYYGHLIVYGFNQLIGWENSVPNVNGNNYDVYNAKADYDGLFKKVKNNANAFCYLAHPNLDDYTLNGTASTALAYAPYNATYDSAIVGTPLRNGSAFSTITNYSDYPQSDYYSYYKKLLTVGYHLGIGYDHDNHNTTFGRNNGGRLVIMAPSLTRANLTAAMQQMHFYASDDWNAKIDFSMNGNMMGSIASGSVVPTFNVIHNDMDGEQAATIKIWKGISQSGGVFPTVVYTSTQNNTATYTDLNLLQGVEYFYFAEIFQGDGQWIVTSPIWYRSTTTLGNPQSTNELASENEIKFNFFPNPVTNKLSITIAECKSHEVSIADLFGRVVFLNKYADNEITIELDTLPKGMYVLKIGNGKTAVSKRLVIE